MATVAERLNIAEEAKSYDNSQPEPESLNP